VLADEDAFSRPDEIYKTVANLKELRIVRFINPTSVMNRSVVFYTKICAWYEPGAHPEFFLGGVGADPEAIYNLYMFLKIMLQESCCKYNITLFAAAFIYIQLKLNIP
jgi:hypothetical protein